MGGAGVAVPIAAAEDQRDLGQAVQVQLIDQTAALGELAGVAYRRVPARGDDVEAADDLGDEKRDERDRESALPGPLDPLNATPSD